jgi:hypothetical protein
MSQKIEEILLQRKKELRFGEGIEYSEKNRNMKRR